MKKTTIVVVACTGLLFSGLAHANDEATCLSGRAKAKGKYEQCVDKWLSSVYRGADFNDISKLAKCRVKYNGTWSKLQKLTSSATCFNKPRFVDNLDGTVTDNLTGLTWEQQKTPAVPFEDVSYCPGGNHCDDVHYVNNVYQWSNANPENKEDGSLFTDFLINLNSGAGFAGANGWRIPTFGELMTSLLSSCPDVPSPCINFMFGPSGGGYYQTITTSPNYPHHIWIVNVVPGLSGAGIASPVPKMGFYFARAVRGGL